MPTYEYECLSCGYHFEIFQMMTDEPVKTCPKCKKRLRRIIGTGSGIIFKGSGFYATDYRKPQTCKATEESKEKESHAQYKNHQDKTSQNKNPQDRKSKKEESSEVKNT
jgi:putative FmdB family regulatory protein